MRDFHELFAEIRTNQSKKHDKNLCKITFNNGVEDFACGIMNFSFKNKTCLTWVINFVVEVVFIF